MGFKENLKEQLVFSGMYVKELAAKSGVKKQTIDSYLNTQGCTPSADAAVAIAKVLGVTVEYLVTGEEFKKSTLYPSEARKVAEITAQMNSKNRKMAVAIIKSMKKQEEAEKEAD